MEDASSTGGRRERNKQKTRRAIESAALDLFESQGFDHTTIEQIAQRADVSLRTFFRYFRSKDQVLLQFRSGPAERVRELLIARPAEEPPFTAVRRAFAQVSTETDPDHLSVLRRRFVLITTTPSLEERSWVPLHAWEQTLRGALEKRTLTHELGPAYVAATVAGVLQWSTTRWVEERGSDLAVIRDEGLRALEAIALEGATRRTRSGR